MVSTPSLQAIKDAILTLSHDERKELLDLLVDTFVERGGQPRMGKRRSILEFEGVGAEMWRGIDAQDYVNKLRREWE